LEERLLIENTTIVTLNSEREILRVASLTIKGEHIEAIGTASEMSVRYPDALRINGQGKVVLPGFINAHTHISMSLQKGITLAVPDGLYRVMWSVEKSLTPEDCYVGALAGSADALKGATTCVVDRYFFAEQTAQALVELGLRGVVGHTIMSRLGPITGKGEFDEAIDFVHRWKDRHTLITPDLAPHATDTVEKEWMIRLRQIATEEGIGLQLHVAQTPQEKAYVQEKHGLGCVAYLDSIDFLDQDVLAAHCIFLDDSEFDILARTGAHPVYCPMGHALGSKPAQAWRMLQNDIGVLIGTDCVTSNNVMDILGELRMAGASQKQLTSDPQAMPALKILEMMTVDAAAAIGMQDQLGALTPGFLADLLILDFDGLHTAPTYSLLDNIIYCCNGRDINTVIVNGQIVVQDRTLVTYKESELVEMVQDKGKDLIRRAVFNDVELEWLWQQSNNKQI
jgi:5-methylthioadenosine/S-adenosylhomocysteine deaminase